MINMLRLFFSYSHQDESYRDELEIHLSSLKRSGTISTWHDRRITGGEDFSNKISEYIESADVVLLLVSPHFLASDYCYDKEMARAMEKHEAGETIILPVILRPCDWKDTPFGRLLAVPRDGRPVSKYPDADDAFLEVVEEIKKIAGPRQSLADEDWPFADPGSATNKAETSEQVPRSSNLRVKRVFSDHDKDTFQVDAFEYIAKFFENSLHELANRNPGIRASYRRTNTNKFSATVYKDGQESSSCTISLNDRGPFASGITFSYGRSGDDSYNEALSVQDDGYMIYLKAFGMAFRGNSSDARFSLEGAAEYYWSLFIERLQ